MPAECKKSAGIILYDVIIRVKNVSKKTFNWKRGITAGLIYFACIGSYFGLKYAYTYSQTDKEATPISHSLAAQQIETVPHPLRATNPDVSVKSVGATEKKNGKERTDTDRAITRAWFDKSGYGVDREHYKSYSETQLEELIKNGDANAMEEMADRKLLSDGVKAAKPYHEKAIIYGSLHSIELLSSFSMPIALMGGTQSVEQAKNDLKEGLAYAEMIRLRGDDYTADLERRVNVPNFEKHFNLQKALTNEEEAWIKNRAQELYNYYESERIKAGLGPFDNEMPKEVKEFFEQ